MVLVLLYMKLFSLFYFQTAVSVEMRLIFVILNLCAVTLLNLLALGVQV